MNKRKLFFWALYDFGNSIVFINFLVYFSQWLVIDGGLADFWYNATFAISTILLLFSAPLLASLTDKFGNRKLFLSISTIGAFLSYALSAFLAIQGYNILLITICFLFSQYFYQLSFVFYNPFIDEISDVSHRGRVSGIGQFSNAIGQVVGLLIMLPLSDSRLAPLLPSSVIFIILTLPMLIFYKEENIQQNQIDKFSFKIEFKQFIKTLLPFFKYSLAIPILLAFFFYNDALVTVTNNYSIYIERVFGIPDSTKSILLMIIVLMNAIGGFIAGWLSDKITIYKTLQITLGLWIIALPIVAFSPSILVFSIVTGVVGLLIGAMWTTSRAYVSTLLTTNNMGFGFSFYTILERFSTLVGPLTWGSIIAFSGISSNSYRIAMLSMTLFIIIGLLIISFWKRKQS